jgi:serine/threonine protein kinase
MSVVWRAADELLGRPVAVKILNRDQASDAATRAFVLSEAKAAARIAHPNVGGVFDYGESVSLDGTTVPYVVMELLAGPSLAQQLESGPLEPQSALWVATEIAAGLAAAHDVGLVHRDVKPGNVILSPSGTKMVDFGIAAIVGEPDGIDASGRVVGTRAYLPPERLRRGVVVPASDMYAWGVLLHCMLTGRPPWPDDATVGERTELVRHADALPGVPAAIDQLFRRCLEPDPSARPTAHEAALAVGAAAGIPFALADVPRQGFPAVAVDAPTAYLRPRSAVRLGPGIPENRRHPRRQGRHKSRHVPNAPAVLAIAWLGYRRRCRGNDSWRPGYLGRDGAFPRPTSWPGAHCRATGVNSADRSRYLWTGIRGTGPRDAHVCRWQCGRLMRRWPRPGRNGNTRARIPTA